MTFANAYVAVRDLVPGQRTDPDGANYDPRAGGPVVPGTWEMAHQGDTGWTMLTLPGGQVLACYLVNVIGARVLLAVSGPKAVLDALAADNDEIMPAREAWRRRLDDTAAPGEASPQQIVRAWRDWRCDVIERDEAGDPLPEAFNVRRTLSSVGVLLPASAPPWNLDADGNTTTQALAVRRVTAVHRPALGITLAGHSIHTVLEDEPDGGL